MKKLLLIILVLFFACEKENTIKDNSIIGEWKCYEAENMNGTFPRYFIYEFRAIYNSFWDDGVNIGTWARDLNKLTIYPYQDEIYSFDILELTESELILKRQTIYYFVRLN